VAESNLTKYNRSLEKMIENKSSRLKEAIITLKMTKVELQKTRKTAIPSEISTLSIDTLDTSNAKIKSNLKKIDHYSQSMSLLLERYNLLENIITSNKEKNQKEKITKTIQGIEDYKIQIEFDTLLKNYPKIITEAVRGIEQISTAASEIKLFVSIDKEPYKPTDIRLLLEKAAAARAKDPHKKIDIQLDLEKVPMVSLPARHMEKAINALLENAFQAIESHGIVSIACQYLNPDIILTVSDLGCGISNDNLPHIFNPYFTGTKKGGKGLGLTFAKSVILNCNGDINLTSSLNQGTTVRVVLPVEETTPLQ
jgi:two-component system NtrC family sensor kinase